MEQEKHGFMYRESNEMYQIYSKAIATILQEKPKRVFRKKEAVKQLFERGGIPRSMLQESGSVSNVFKSMVNRSKCDPEKWGGVFDNAGKGRYKFTPNEQKEAIEDKGNWGEREASPRLFDPDMQITLNQLANNQFEMIKKLNFICEYLNERKPKEKKKKWGKV